MENFEAAIEAGKLTGKPVQPEIMIPLVSTVRELNVLSEAIKAVAKAVQAEHGAMVPFTIGVMIETPRACLRAAASSMRSFGKPCSTAFVHRCALLMRARAFRRRSSTGTCCTAPITSWWNPLESLSPIRLN